MTGDRGRLIPLWSVQPKVSHQSALVYLPGIQSVNWNFEYLDAECYVFCSWLWCMLGCMTFWLFWPWASYLPPCLSFSRPAKFNCNKFNSAFRWTNDKGKAVQNNNGAQMDLDQDEKCFHFKKEENHDGKWRRQKYEIEKAVQIQRSKSMKGNQALSHFLIEQTASGTKPALSRRSSFQIWTHQQIAWGEEWRGLHSWISLFE